MAKKVKTGIAFSTVMGFLSGAALIVAAVVMATKNYSVFLSISSFFMVVGGTIAATFIAYESKYIFSALSMAFSTFFTDREGQAVLKHEVGRIIKWGYIVQKSGLQGLETDAEQTLKQEAFTRFGVDLVITGYSGAEIRDILYNATESTYNRSMQNVDILKSMGSNAPAFGMLGTLVGLIIMLGNMSDFSSIGPGMALALITTLYGIIVARLLFLPSASKVGHREAINRFKHILMAEGLAMLAERKSPRYIQDKMNAFLPSNDHFLIDRDMKRRGA